MSLERKNLWAPWRMEYIRGLTEETDCFLCDYISSPDKDTENLVLWRTERNIVVFNRFPYNNGHLLIAPRRHIGELDQAEPPELLEFMLLTRDCQQVLKQAVHPHGFNVGINFGRCAGAGLPEHLHLHIVPRWNGDTNYMAVCAQTEVISQSLSELYQRLREISETESFPRL
ncbi:MAG: HIT domain-containing protein [Sedimentisphaerales bacterium]|nr:HIT domain-containing protein [Sedimentisphaerales bacterium]